MHRHLSWDLFRSVALILLIALPPSVVVAEEKDNKLTLVILGDSLTAGYGIEKEMAYPNLLEQRAQQDNIPLRVVNAGISGDTSAGGLRRLNWALKSKADIFVLALGANDGLRGLKPEQTKENLLNILDAVRSKFPAVKVYLAPMEMPPNMGEEYRARFREIFKEIAAEKEIPLLPFILEGIAGEPTLMLPDGMHPSEKGHQKISEMLWPIMKRALTE